MDLDQTLTDAEILLKVAAQAAITDEPAGAETSAQKPKRPTPEPIVWAMPGFCGKSKVLTSFGNLPIEALRKNDPLKTAAGEFRKVTWVDKVTFEPEFLASHPEAQPVLIAAGKFGAGKPAVDMLVSPAQSVQSSARYGSVAFRKAKELVQGGGGTARPQSSVTYFLFGCDSPIEVCVDGIWCQVGPKAAGDDD